MGDNFLKIVGARILSEFNDLKRTPESAAQELNFDEAFVNCVLNGEETKENAFKLIHAMGEKYPIDIHDLFLVEDDSNNGVIIMREKESKSSSRVFSRPNREGIRTPYYDYRDTSMSRLAPFKPEWIKELRIVDDNDPYNPDVVYNNGHFMHQMTFFIGPVNFYYEIGKKKYCVPMNTGDSNYITPFFRHSFTSRDKNELALIIAVTFGGDVRRSQKEFYALGNRATDNFSLDYRSNKANLELILQHLRNENITTDELHRILESKNLSLDINSLLSEEKEVSFEDLSTLASLLNTEIGDLMIAQYKPDEEVVVRKCVEEDSYYYPSSDEKSYRIFPLARSSKMPLMKGFDIRILAKNNKINNGFFSSLHQYAYNYGNCSIVIEWEIDENTYSDILNPGDSMYMQPFIRHSFNSLNGEEASIIALGVSGSVNLSAQRELSYFSDSGRVAHETRKWFD